MRRRLRSLLDQLGAILLSLLLAVVIWLIAMSQENPLETKVFELPVTVRGLDAALQTVEDLSAQTARVTVRAPRDASENLGAEDFSVSIDLAGRQSGEHDVPVQVVVNDPRADITNINPPNLRLQLDPLLVEPKAVAVQVEDAPAFGYDALMPVVDPPTVTVSGPASQMDLVDRVVAPIELANAKSQVERTVEVQALNRQEQPVSGVTIEPSLVRVVVPVEQWPGRKEVAVRINLVGQPAAGYRLSTVRAEPSTVVLQGDSAALAEVAGYVETAPLDIDGATGDVRERLQLMLPAGVTAFDGNSMLALVSVAPIEGGSTVTVKPIVQGTGPGLEATVSPETVDVILSGPVPLLDALDPDDMFVILDLDGLLPGTHVVTPRVVLPEGIVEEGVLPETVEVVLSAMPGGTIPPPVESPRPPDASPAQPAAEPTASPTATSTPTPTATPTSTRAATPAVISTATRRPAPLRTATPAATTRALP
jgi:YbbR domain-containing protein